MSTTRIPVIDLVLDDSIYPRSTIDESHIKRLTEALETGAVLPPIVAEQGSNRIVDGAHRRGAYLRHRGERAMAAVEFRTYENEADLFADAITLNAQTKRPLTSQDATRIVIMGQSLGIPIERVAGLLEVPVDKLQRRTLIGFPMVRVSGAAQQRIALKRTMAPFAGRQLTPAQIEANLKAGGMPPIFYVRQVAMLVEAEALDLDNEQLVIELRGLSDLLNALDLPAAEDAA